MTSNKVQQVQQVTADEVRAWAHKRGIEVAEYGRLSGEVIAAFNKAHTKVQYASTMRQPARVIKLAGKRTVNGRPYNVVHSTTYDEVRDWAFRKGYTLGARGRIPQVVLDAFATREVKPVRRAA